MTNTSLNISLKFIDQTSKKVVDDLTNSFQNQLDKVGIGIAKSFEKAEKSSQEITNEEKKQTEEAQKRVGLAEKIGNSLKSAGSSIGGAMKSLGPAMIAMTLIQKVLDKLIDEIGGVVTSLMSGLQSALQPITDTIKMLGKLLKPIFDTIFATLGVILEKLMGALQNLVPLFQKIIDPLMQMINPMLDVIIVVVDQIIVGFKPLFQTMFEIFKTFDPVRKIIIDIVLLIAKIVVVLSPIFQGVGMLANVLMSIVKWFQEGVIKTFQIVASVSEWLGITEFIEKGIAGIADIFGNLLGTSKQIAQESSNTAKSERDRAKSISDARNAQTRLMQAQQDGGKITDAERADQELLLNKLKEQQKQYKVLNDIQIQQRNNARSIIAKDNTAEVALLQQKLEAGEDITEELKKQQKNVDGYNALIKAGNKLRIEEKMYLSSINDLQKDAMESQFSIYDKQLKVRGKLDKDQEQGLKKEAARLKLAIEANSVEDANQDLRIDKFNRIAGLLGSAAWGETSNKVSKEIEKVDYDLKSLDKTLAELRFQNSLNLIDDESLRKETQLLHTLENDVNAIFENINSKRSNKQSIIVNSDELEAEISRLTNLQNAGKKINKEELNSYISQLAIIKEHIKANEKEITAIKANELQKQQDARLKASEDEYNQELARYARSRDLQQEIEKIRYDKSSAQGKYTKDLNDLENWYEEQKRIFIGNEEDMLNLLEIYGHKKHEINKKITDAEKADLKKSFDDDLNIVQSNIDKMIANIENAINRNNELENQKQQLKNEEDELQKSLEQREITYQEYNDKLNEIDEKRNEIQKDSDKVYAAAFKELLKGILQNTIDSILSSLQGYLIEKQTLALLNAPDTFGLSLLKLGAYSAAIQGGKALLSSIVQNFQKGGVVKRINGGVDREPAMLTAGERIFDLKTLSIGRNSQWLEKIQTNKLDIDKVLNQSASILANDNLNRIGGKIDNLGNVFVDEMGKLGSRIERLENSKSNKYVNIVGTVDIDQRELIKNVDFSHKQLRNR
jgi:hypothetical protein